MVLHLMQMMQVAYEISLGGGGLARPPGGSIVLNAYTKPKRMTRRSLSTIIKHNCLDIIKCCTSGCLKFYYFVP